MKGADPPRTEEDIDWGLTTWEGSRREHMRRWAELPLERAIMALEEMEALFRNLQPAPSSMSEVREPPATYGRDAAPCDLPLPGCTPEPLMAYLKALGVLRLVSEQRDETARGWWKNDVFWLRSSLDRQSLLRFFLEKYEPTPIIVPWSGGDFFAVNWNPGQVKHSKTPTSSKAIEAFLCTRSPRFDSYRAVLIACKAALESCGIDTQEKMQQQKWSFIQALRSICDEPLVLDWIDAAAITGIEKFAPLLGSGGGSDGNTHFSDNFMQNLWDVLPDFDDQRKVTSDQVPPSVAEVSLRQLNEALFAVSSNDRVIKRTSSLFDSGAVGGPNATQGMVRESLSNPWDVIFTLEGALCFAGATSKRLAANARSEAVFPFQLSATVTNCDRLADKEAGGKEVWLPLWARPARSGEILTFLREGRAQCGARPARSGVDMARAIASLGVDRGVQAFHRYSIVKGRVGGDNYNTAASLGRFEVVERSGVDLLLEIDPWLRHFRYESAKDAPPRFVSALRRIDTAVFDFCKYGGAPLFQEIVIALGAAERALAAGERFREARNLRPLAGLSPAWVQAAYDGSVEFAVAQAVASVHDPESKIGPLRTNLEPVDWRKKCRGWAEKNRAVVWNAADLATNLSGVLQRRLMDGQRAGCACLPLASHFTIPLQTVAAYLAGEIDDQRIEDLMWGLMLIRAGGATSRGRAGADDASVPRAYALLKLLFLPRPLLIERGADGRCFARLLRYNESGGVVIRPEPSILHLLRGGRLGEACAIAMRRLRATGLDPMPGPIRGRGVRDRDWRELDRMRGPRIDPRRLAAALLIPIDANAVSRLVRLIIRDEDVVDDRAGTAAGVTF